MALNGSGEDLGCGGLWLRVAGCSLLRQYPPGPLCLSSPRSRRLFLGAPDRSGDEGAASAAGAAGSHLPAHGRLPAAWLPHAGRDVRGLRGEERLGTWDPGWGRGPGHTALDQRSPLDPIARRLTPAPCAFWPLDDPPPGQTAENLLRGLPGARLRRGQR